MAEKMVNIVFMVVMFSVLFSTIVASIASMKRFQHDKGDDRKDEEKEKKGKDHEEPGKEKEPAGDEGKNDLSLMLEVDGEGGKG